MASFDAGSTDASRPFAEEGYALMGAAFEVHRELGGGLFEEAYQQSLEIEFAARHISYCAKQNLDIYYKKFKLNTYYIPDFIVAGQIVVELKAISRLTQEHEAQLLNYMRIARLPVGYLINFAPMARLEWKRFVLSEYLQFCS